MFSSSRPYHWVFLALAISACEAETQRPATPDVPQVWYGVEGRADRSFVDVTWDTVGTFGSPEDTVLAWAGNLRESDGVLALFDYQMFHVATFDSLGGLRWIVGRRGSGPGEFRSVKDLQFDETGRLFVLDEGNARITVIGPDGDIETMYTAPVLRDRPQAFAPLEDGVVVITSDRNAPAHFFEWDSQSTTSVDFPWLEYRTLPTMLKQGVSAVDRGRWVFLLLGGNTWFSFDGLQSINPAGQFVEHSDLANRPCRACRVSLLGDTLFVHWGGSTEDAWAIIDVYTIDGDYHYSFRLPSRVSNQGVAIGRGNRAYVFAHSPYPRLVVLRFR